MTDNFFQVSRMNKLFICFIFLAGLSSAQYAEFASTGYSAGAANYLWRPLNARSAALAGAVTAWTEDLTGAQFNPAIFDAVAQNAIMLDGTYSLMTYDRKHAGVQAAGAFGNYLAYGISFINYGVSDIEGRDDYGILTKNFNDNENALTASVAGKMVANISLGASVRYLFNTFEKEHANGVGVDLGATWAPLPQLCVGASIQHIASKLWWSTGHSDPVLPVARLGVSGIFLKKSLHAEMDFVKTQKQPEQVACGVEYVLLDLISLRGGITTDLDFSSVHAKYPDYSFGLGVKYSSFFFDYACLIPDSDLGLIHKFSIGVAIKDIFN
jgi:hypothetical protein